MGPKRNQNVGSKDHLVKTKVQKPEVSQRQVKRKTNSGYRACST